MRNPQGYETLFDVAGGGGLLGEQDTFTCHHCQRIVSVPVKADPANIGGLCKICMNLICPKCVNIGSCTPWVESMRRMEAKAAARRSYGF